MSRLNVTLSDDLEKALDDAAAENQTTKSDLLRKALQLYLAALAGKKEGRKIGLFAPDSKEIETEIIGL